MITAIPHNFFTPADANIDCSLGNVLFTMAGIIGVGQKNNYAWGFYPWPNQKYFEHPVPVIKNRLKLGSFQNPINYKGFDVGFRGFDIPDNMQVRGYFGSEKYFEHCKDTIRFFFKMKTLCRTYDDAIIVHCRNYNLPEMFDLGRDYYLPAIKRFPDKRVVVVTDNIEKAKKKIGEDFEYISTSPILDFYIMTKAKYLIMSNSTFSWWGAWLSKAETIAPNNWYAGDFIDCPKQDLYCKEWTIL